MDFEPRLTFLTCVWLAMKVEEFNTVIDAFCYNLFNTKQEATQSGDYFTEAGDEILAFELSIMKALNYDLIVHTPFRPLSGFVLDIDNYSIQYSQNLNMKPLYHQANLVLFSMLKTDLMLLYSPSLLALSSLAIASLKIRNKYPQVFKNFGDYMKNYLIQREDIRNSVQKAIKNISKILKQADELPQIEIEKVNVIKQKIEISRNPVFNPRSQEFKQAVDDDNEIRVVMPDQSIADYGSLGSNNASRSNGNPDRPPIPARKKSHIRNLNMELFNDSFNNNNNDQEPYVID